MKAAADASVLIFFAKLGRLDILSMLFQVHASQTVFNEVLAGKDRNPHEVGLIEGMIGAKKLVLIKDSGKAKTGEESVIEVARNSGCKTILMDDLSGIRVAKAQGMAAYSSPFILLLALRQRIIGPAEFEALLDRLLGFNYFISPRLLRLVLEKSRKLGENA